MSSHRQSPRHILFRSPSEGSGLRSRPPAPPPGVITISATSTATGPGPGPGATSSASSGDGGDTQCSSVLYIPTGGGATATAAAEETPPPPPPRDASSRSVHFVRPGAGPECHRTGLQFPVNVDERPSPTARLFSPPRPRSQTPTASPLAGRATGRPVVIMNSSGTPGGAMPSISCRDNVLEIRPAAGDCCVRVNASPGGKVRIKIPSTQQSSRVTRFRIADSLKLYGESEEGRGATGWRYNVGPTADFPPDFHFASPPTSIRLPVALSSGVGIRRERRPSDDAALAAARAKKRHSYAFEGDHEEALHESRIDNFVLESLNEVCDTSVKSESKIFHILANKIENQGPEAGNLWTAFSTPELINFLKILEIEERDLKRTIIFKYKLLKYRITKLMSAQRKLSQ